MMNYYEDFFEKIKMLDGINPIKTILYTTKRNNKFIFSNVIFIDVRNREKSIDLLKAIAKKMNFVFFNEEPNGKKWIKENKVFYINEIFGKLENQF